MATMIVNMNKLSPTLKKACTAGYHLSIEGIRKGYLFVKKWYILACVASVSILFRSKESPVLAA